MKDFQKLDKMVKNSKGRDPITRVNAQTLFNPHLFDKRDDSSSNHHHYSQMQKPPNSDENA